jgi:hypothetical protein
MSDLFQANTGQVVMPAPPRLLGIMQPYFFPYFEQFRLLAACDLWVAFDTSQYSRKSWINRNRVLNKDTGATYVSVPVKHGGVNVTIKEAVIDQSKDWQADVLNKLRVYKKRAPQYESTIALVAEAISYGHGTLGALNSDITRHVSRFLGIDTPIVLASELPITWPSEAAPDEWALHISKALQAREYRNSAGGKSFFDESKYAAAGVKLSFHQHLPHTYHTADFEFFPNLSIIDWLMWNDLATLQEWLK